ncbi:hypothetical protein N8649_02725 [bacterium]|nr:hypothetical protein [bacterium]
MRKRCFIIAAIALVIGVFFDQRSYPSEMDIMVREKMNDNVELNNEIAEMHGENYRYKREDPYRRDPDAVAISRVSYCLVGVMLLVGFLVGPSKEEVVSNKDQNESSS